MHLQSAGKKHLLPQLMIFFLLHAAGVSHKGIFRSGPERNFFFGNIRKISSQKVRAGGMNA